MPFLMIILGQRLGLDMVPTLGPSPLPPHLPFQGLSLLDKKTVRHGQLPDFGTQVPDLLLANFWDFFCRRAQIRRMHLPKTRASNYGSSSGERQTGSPTQRPLIHL